MLTTNLKQAYIRMEITFWVIAVQLLRESTAVQGMVRLGHRVLVHNRWILRLPRPILWAVAGLALGFLAGALYALP